MTIEKLIGNQGAFTKPEGRHLPIPIGFCQDGSIKELDILETWPYRVYITGLPGSGKSTLLQNIVANGALRYSPDELIFNLVDMMNEGTFDYFSQLPHVKSVSSSDEISIYKWLEQEESKRINLFRYNDVPNIEMYNKKAIQEGRETLPYCFFIIDEFYRLIEHDILDYRHELFRWLGKGNSHQTGIVIVVAGRYYSTEFSFIRGTKIALRSNKHDSVTVIGNDKATLLDNHGQAIVNTAEYDKEGKYNEIIQVAYIDAKKDLPIIAQKIEDKYKARW